MVIPDRSRVVCEHENLGRGRTTDLRTQRLSNSYTTRHGEARQSESSKRHRFATPLEKSLENGEKRNSFIRLSRRVQPVGLSTRGGGVGYVPRHQSEYP
jgi:hypothetical protein